MADTATAAPAASNPAEAPKTESPVKSESDSQVEKTEAADSKANGDAEESKSDDAGEKKPELNGKSRDRDGDRRSQHNDRRDRNGKHDRSDRRYDGGRDQRHSKPYSKPNFKKRNTEFENLPETDDPSEIRDQVEFYFSIQNLATDEHLFKELDGPSNRPVPIKHLHSFKRMRRFQPYSAVVAALRESNDLIVVDDGEFSGTGKEAVKRKEPLVLDIKGRDKKNPPSTEEYFNAMKSASSNSLERSIYAKDFGDLEQAGQIALEKFFRPFGSVMLRKRRDDRGRWKGSIFVEFDTEESVQQFLDLDPKPKFNDNRFVAMAKKEYVEMKCKEKGIKPDWELTEKERYEQRQRLRDEEGGGRGHHNNNRRGSHRGFRGGRDSGRGHGRYNDHRNRSRSPRRRRSSNASVDDDDWNARRDRYRKGQDDRGSAKKKAPEIERDAYGVPVVQDTRTEAEKAASAAKKRKADDDAEERAVSPAKKSKIEFKEDE